VNINHVALIAKASTSIRRLYTIQSAAEDRTLHLRDRVRGAIIEHIEHGQSVHPIYEAVLQAQ